MAPNRETTTIRGNHRKMLLLLFTKGLMLYNYYSDSPVYIFPWSLLPSFYDDTLAAQFKSLVDVLWSSLTGTYVLQQTQESLDTRSTELDNLHCMWHGHLLFVLHKYRYGSEH